ncbi:MAG: hypothetical protein HQL27_07365 [Candidatus Omnitrophica bacterium]|nr:hypothetical protein [Candidatus Omnitrophota bacterium]
MRSIRIPKKIEINWIIKEGKVFKSFYKYDTAKRIFKFCYQPVTGELLFDIAPKHHNIMILNNGRKKFDDYIRGICFWDKKIIYLRGHDNAKWLKETKEMLYSNGIPRNYRVVWGEKAALELADDLRGL